MSQHHSFELFLVAYGNEDSPFFVTIHTILMSNWSFFFIGPELERYESF